MKLLSRIGALMLMLLALNVMAADSYGKWYNGVDVSNQNDMQWVSPRIKEDAFQGSNTHVITAEQSGTNSFAIFLNKLSSDNRGINNLTFSLVRDGVETMHSVDIPTISSPLSAGNGIIVMADGVTFQQNDKLTFYTDRGGQKYAFSSLTADGSVGNVNKRDFDPEYGLSLYYALSGRGNSVKGHLDFQLAFGNTSETSEISEISAYVINSTEGEMHVSGQPLPGVLLSLVTGAGVAYACKRRRK